MSFSIIQNVLWAGSFSAQAILLLVLMAKQRWREFRVFTAWIAFLTAESIGLFVIYREGSPRLYADVYWLSVITEFFLQLGVVLEIARIVLRPTGTWLHDARLRFVLSGIAGALIAAGVAVILHPSAPTSLDAWEIRGNLFTGIIVLELCSAMMGAANRLGLQWDTHVMGLGQGLAVWAIVAVIVDAFHNLLGRYQWFNFLENMRIVVWIAAVIYWGVVFLRPQKERLPLSQDMQKYLVDLHARVQYDLSRTESASRLRNNL